MESILNCTGHELKIPNIVKSDGVYLFDANEKRYMDLESGVWCTSLGHKNRRINGVIKEQIDQIMHAGFCYSSEIVDKAAKSILNIVGFNKGKSVFISSGSEAVEISRQMAKHLTEKHISLTLHDSYLGAYSSLIEKTSNWYLVNWEQCKVCPDKEKCNLSCKVLQDIPKDVSEFIFEPGSSSGFVRFPPKALIQNIVQIVRDNGGKIIANEVTTGIGRTGKWFGFQHYDIIPDFVAVGKGIGNGYPVSITLINEASSKQLELKPFHYSQSHQNDPLGAAVVKEVIQTIRDENLIERAQKNAEIFNAQLHSIVDGEVITAIRGRGLMFAIDLASEKITNEIYDKLLEHGYIVCNRGSFLRLDPPLIITEKQFSEFIDTLSFIVASIKK
ncbi:MAG: aspartate aminotransferase family protein [Halarcobacter sp.]